MIHLHWRGWGLMAVVSAFLPLACCVGLMDYGQGQWAFLTAGAAMVLGGIPCWVYGRKWNWKENEHSLYFVPLQYWGVFYVVFGTFLFLGAIAGIVKQRAARQRGGAAPGNGILISRFLDNNRLPFLTILPVKTDRQGAARGPK